MVDFDPVGRPGHYNSHPSGIECGTIAEHHTFWIGSVIKYVWRAGLKADPGEERERELMDLRKARECLDREIRRLERDR